MKYDDLSFTRTPTLDPQTRACMNLWAEVFRVGLVDAAESVKKGCAEPYWIMSNEDHIGSFVWRCELFDYNPDTIRSKWRMNLRPIVRKNQEVLS